MSTPLYRSRPGGFEILPASQNEATAINDFIYLSTGLSNSYLIVTAEGRVVINTGMGFEAPIHRELYDAVDDGPIRYILLTQGHVDHVGGVDRMRDPGTEIVAHAANAAQQADDARLLRFRAARSAFAFRETIARALRYLGTRNPGGPPPVQSRPEPTITFNDQYEFELGGVRFELISTPGGETLDSLCVWLPQHGIVFTGNLFSALFGHFPNLVTIRGDHYRDALRFIESLERIMALQPEVLLPGHHEPIRGQALIRTELERLRGAVEYVHDATVRGMNEGLDLNTLMRTIELPSELQVGEGYGKVSWCVRAIWENYAGWFHHESTAELYPEPASTVHEDLVDLAGGPQAVTQRAQTKLAQNAPVQAIHLAEIALSVDPDFRPALEVNRTAHEALLRQTNNFWEISWLRQQIQEIETRLPRA